MMNKRRIVLALLLSTTLAACADRGGEAEMIAAAPAQTEMDDAKPRVDGQLEAVDGDLGRAEVQRKLIRNAELQVEVQSYEEARRELDGLLDSVGGFVADAQVHHDAGEVSRADLTLRIPSDKLDSFLADVSGSGRVLHETLSSQDITEAYFDTKARLDNARRLERRLQDIMAAEATNMKDLLEVERELARVRGEIERYEGQMRLWDRQVALSTVKVSLFTERVYAPQKPKTLGERAHQVLEDSWDLLASVGQGLLLFAVALLPWILPLGLLGWALRSLYRRSQRKARARQAAQAEAWRAQQEAYAAQVYGQQRTAAAPQPGVTDEASHDSLDDSFDSDAPPPGADAAQVPTSRTPTDQDRAQPSA